MGCAIAKMAMLRGAQVTLVHGPISTSLPPFVETISVTSAQDMFDAVTQRASEMDLIIKAAAVADYTPETYSENKVKKSDDALFIPLKRTQDILNYLGHHRTKRQVICGFSMETENLVENSRKKLTSKNVDLICANNLKTRGAGFGVDTNVITLIDQQGVLELPLQSKEAAANTILDRCVSLLNS